MSRTAQCFTMQSGSHGFRGSQFSHGCLPPAPCLSNQKGASPQASPFNLPLRPVPLTPQRRPGHGPGRLAGMMAWRPPPKDYLCYQELILPCMSLPIDNAPPCWDRSAAWHHRLRIFPPSTQFSFVCVRPFPAAWPPGRPRVMANGRAPASHLQPVLISPAQGGLAPRQCRDANRRGWQDSSAGVLKHQ